MTSPPPFHFIRLVILLASILTITCQAKNPFVQRFDQNGDGKLSKSEVPAPARRIFENVDKNGDGFVTPEEDDAFRKTRAGRDNPDKQHKSQLTPPDHTDIAYGEHERNVYDLWLATSKTPTPLVVYYHGGGFRGGDKRSINHGLLNTMLKEGISVAAVNYRLSSTATFPAQMHDCAKALQHIRLHSKKYNISPERIAATGGSAGGHISLWLAFHDDLANPESKKMIERQSTRLVTAAVSAAQSSIDPRFIQKLFNTNQVNLAVMQFFGMQEVTDIDNKKFHPLFEEASPLNHLTPDDVPVMALYNQANEELPPNSSGRRHIHHPKFGIILKEKMQKEGLECTLVLRENYQGNTTDKLADYLVKKLNSSPATPASNATGSLPLKGTR